MKTKLELGKNVFWGLLLILAAAFIVLGQFDVFGDVSGVTIFFGICLGAWFISSMFKLSWGGMLFSAAFEIILFDEALGLEELTPWPVLFAALLATIGMNLLIKKKSRKPEKDIRINKNKQGNPNVDLDDATSFRCEVAFGSVVKYVTNKELKHASLDNSFGSLMVYFDTATLGGGMAIAELDNSFGKITIFVPKEWDTRVEIEKTFGKVIEEGHKKGDSDNIFVVRGSSTFGNVYIRYI